MSATSSASAVSAEDAAGDRLRLDVPRPKSIAADARDCTGVNLLMKESGNASFLGH